MSMQVDDGKEPLAIVTGCTSGLGLAITMMLLASGWRVVGWAMEEPNGLLLPEPVRGLGERFTYQKVDVRWVDDIADAVVDLPDLVGEDNLDAMRVDALINCAGINYLQPFEQFEFAAWENVMDTNAKALALTARVCLPFLANKADPWSAGTILNIVSNAAHVPMTHSLAYNASKGAALMVTKQLARELFKSHGITVLSISPNKLAGTRMSREIEARVPELRGWTQEEAGAYQAAALPTAMETPPEAVAEFITYLLSNKRRHIFLHGCDIPYGG